VTVDELVHARLREAGLVGLVVPVPAASGSSPFTWKIGACTILATSVA
jgi:hypothetical protein